MSTDDLKLISLWVHVPTVTAWIGFVMLDVVAFLIPGLGRDQRLRMVTWSRSFTVAAIVVILVTGVYQTVYNPVGPEVKSFGELEQLREKTYGFALFIKHGFVLATFVLTLAVRFVLAPRMERGDTSGLSISGGGAAAVATSSERLVLLVSAVNLLACLGALISTTRMVFQLH
jgi:putative copper export protein